MSIDNRKARAEEARIFWRVWVMQQPGGPAWLLEKARAAKFKEREVGPNTLKWGSG